MVQIRGLHSDMQPYRWWNAVVERQDPGEIVLVWPAGTRFGAPTPEGRKLIQHDCRMYFWPGVPYTLVEQYGRDGLAEIAMDIARSLGLENGVCTYVDHELDVIKPVGGDTYIEDEDEFEEAVALYGYSEAFQRACHAAVRAAIDVIEGWRPGDRPDPDLLALLEVENGGRRMAVNGERCSWARGSEEMMAYHDREWGVPIQDDRHLFELLTLEGAQAGLSWATILRRRDGYRDLFEGFDPAVVAGYGAERIDSILQSPRIIRNRAKVESTVGNARALLRVAEEFGSFSTYLWGFVGGRQKTNCWSSPDQVPAESEESRALSKDLRARGFRFVGPTICYAYMQSAGLVNDHLACCFRHAEIMRLTAASPTDPSAMP